MSKDGRKTNAVLDLDYLVLSTLVSGPSHGYAIRGSISERTEGQVSLALATVYETFNRLLVGDLIKRAEDIIVSGRLRRMYSITGRGEQLVLARERIAASLLDSRIQRGSN